MDGLEQGQGRAGWGGVSEGGGGLPELAEHGSHAYLSAPLPPAAHYILSSSLDGKIRLWDYEKGRAIKVYQVGCWEKRGALQRARPWLGVARGPSRCSRRAVGQGGGWGVQAPTGVEVPGPSLDVPALHQNQALAVGWLVGPG